MQEDSAQRVRISGSAPTASAVSANAFGGVEHRPVTFWGHAGSGEVVLMVDRREGVDRHVGVQAGDSLADVAEVC